MQKNFRVNDRIKIISNTGDERYFEVEETGTVLQVGANSLFIQFDYRPGTDGRWYAQFNQCELLPGSEKLSDVTEKVDHYIWGDKAIQSDEAFKSKPGYALAAVVKVLLAKGVLTPSDFDLLKTEESALTTVPANKD